MIEKSPADSLSPRQRWAGAAALLLTPALSLVLHVLPPLKAAPLVATAVGLILAISGLAGAARFQLPAVVARGAGLMAVAWLVFVYLSSGFGLLHLLATQLALLACGHWIGGAIGRRVEFAGHVLPAAMVAMAADVASVFSPEGISHSIAKSDASLRTLVLTVPVPGGKGFAFVLGLGDLVFAALLFGVAARHQIRLWLVALGCGSGAALAIALSAWLSQPIPALVGIGLGCIALVPRFREVRARERTLVRAAIVVSMIVVIAVVARRVAG